MNKQQKRAIYTMILFGLLLIYLVLNFTIVGVDNFINRTNLLITSGCILLTGIGFAYMLYATNKKNAIIDERDDQIQLQATNIGIILTTMFVFILMIGLFIGYEEEGQVPVSWMWFTAYTTSVFSFFSTSSIIVILYRRI